MKLEQQVTSLELSKKLKELGVAQDSLFYWWGTFNYRPYPQPEQYEEHEKERAYQDQDWQVSLKKDIFDEDSRSWKGMYKNTLDIFSAFSVAELGEMLPRTFRIKNLEGSFVELTLKLPTRIGGGWLYYLPITYKDRERLENPVADLVTTSAETEADCRAKMLIWLIERDYITQ